MILPPEFYQKKSTVRLAKELLGTFLVHDSPHGRTVGRIVETEAYLLNDAACHANKGKTPRNAVMFGPPGHAYIYFIYGMYHCFNVVTAREGVGEAVLIRALEPIHGIAVMQKRRKTSELHQLCSGPGKLVLAMGITPSLNGAPLFKGALTLWSADSFAGHPAPRKMDIVTTPRIGITLATELPLRFYIKGCAFASRRCRLSAK
jgi:DNA-3-methyladenine glycosylase